VRVQDKRHSVSLDGEEATIGSRCRSSLAAIVANRALGGHGLSDAKLALEGREPLAIHRPALLRNVRAEVAAPEVAELRQASSSAAGSTRKRSYARQHSVFTPEIVAGGHGPACEVVFTLLLDGYRLLG